MEGCGRLWKVVEGSRRFSKVVEGSRRFSKVLEGCRRLSKVPEGDGAAKHFGLAVSDFSFQRFSFQLFPKRSHQ
jgi:hypothetical protein